MNNCSIIIRAYNEDRHIARLLTGIQQQKCVNADVILVDSGSTDSTVAIARQFDVRVVNIRPEDFTFGRALNLGCQHAKSDFLVFASAHVYPVFCDWLKRMLAPFDDPNVGLTYGRQIGNEQTKYSEHRIFAKWFPEKSDLNQPHPFCNNANVAVRKSLWEKYGYDESLTGLEDLDFAKRVQKNGNRLAYLAEATIVHVHEETRKTILNRYRREAIALRQIMPEESMSLIDFARLFVGNTISDWAHALRDRQLARNIVDIPMFRLMQFWGAYRGFNQRGPVSQALRNRFYYPNQIGREVEVSDGTAQEMVDYSQSHSPA